MPTVLCDKRVTCPCTDSPVSNYSAEDPDARRFQSSRYWSRRPKLGGTVGDHYIGLGCMAVCYSTESQQAADDCALRNAQQCVWDDWTDPTGNPYVVFCNNQAYCLAYCADGSPFYSSIRAGTVCALSQLQADRLAGVLACRRNMANRVCIDVSNEHGCVGSDFECLLTLNGATGIAFWYFAGALPAGLTWSVTAFSNQIRIHGTPTVAGIQSVIVTGVDLNGDYMTKTINFRFFQITTADIIPDVATVGTDFTMYFTTAGGSGSNVWELTEGDLPDGLTLGSDGTLQGTPTKAGVFDFTLKVCDQNF